MFVHPYEYDGIRFQSSEHHFHYTKCMRFGRQDVAQEVLSAQGDGNPRSRDWGPKIAKRKASAKGRMQLTPKQVREWQEEDCCEMVNVLTAKFADPAMRRVLLNTGNRFLEERTGGYCSDRYWGTGSFEEGGTGNNYLGRCLMVVRKHYRELEAGGASTSTSTA